MISFLQIVISIPILISFWLYFYLILSNLKIAGDFDINNRYLLSIYKPFDPKRGPKCDKYEIF